MAVAPEFFGNILGTTDSEVMFHLALTFGLESDPPGALARMAGFIEKVARDHGIPQPLWMTVGVSDGKTLYGVRYASDNDAPTLFHSPDVQDIYKLNPAVAGLFGDSAHVIISEPAGKFPELWAEIPQGSLVIVRGGDIETRPFQPET